MSPAPRTASSCPRAISRTCRWTASSARIRRTRRRWRWTSCSSAAAPRAWPAPSSWRAWSRRTRRRAASWGRSRSRSSRRRKRSAGIPSRARWSTRPPLRELFPELKDADFPFRAPVGAERVYLLTESRALRLPTPPDHAQPRPLRGLALRDRALAGREGGSARRQHVHRLPRRGLLVEGDRVRGVRTTPSGLKRDGQPGTGYTPPTDITAKVTVLSEGTRGALTQAWLRWQKVGSDEPA